MTDQERIDNLTDAAQEERRIEENGPCIACGAYNKTHESGCTMLGLGSIIADECGDGFHGACPNHLIRCDCKCHTDLQ